MRAKEAIQFQLAATSSYRMTFQHSHNFQHSELCRVAMQYPMLDLNEALQLPCFDQH